MASIRRVLAAGLIGAAATVGGGCGGPALSSADDIAAMNRAELEREEVRQCMAEKGVPRRPDCMCVVARIRPAISDRELRAWLIGLRRDDAGRPAAIDRDLMELVARAIADAMKICGIPL